MKKIFLILLVSLMAISLVLAANGNSGAGQQGTGNGTQTNTETQTQNQGEETQLQNQVQTRVQSGTYINQVGEQMQVQMGEGNEVRLRVGDVEAKSTMTMTQERDQVQNRTMLKTQLSNGKNAEIKVMPDTASKRAIERLQLKVCNSENNCQIELKEVGNGEQVKAAYEVKAQKEARVLGMFKTKMQVRAQVDAETGEVIQAKKPWWAFLATE